MPRYYFHLTGGKQVLNDHKGIDLKLNGDLKLCPAGFATEFGRAPLARVPSSSKMLATVALDDGRTSS
jgi:hypothetical protein